MRLAVMLAGLLALSACGNRSMLGPDLDQGLRDVDAAIARGDVEVACARLRELTGPFRQWAENARGERAAVGNQMVERLSDLGLACGKPGDPARLTAGWPPVYKEIQRISTYKTSWLTVFTYASMFAVGLGTWFLLRRMRRSE